MDQSTVIAAVLWAGFVASLIVGAVTILGVGRIPHRTAPWLFMAIIGTLAFSFIAGFSVGRFTAAIPVLLTGYMIGMGRGPLVMAACLGCAGAVYLILSWLVTPQLATIGLLAILSVAWGIPIYLVLAIAAFGWVEWEALTGPPVQPRIGR